LGTIERGDLEATLPTYLKLSRALGLPMGSLLDEGVGVTTTSW
jgi:hypothetical protein